MMRMYLTITDDLHDPGGILRDLEAAGLRVFIREGAVGSSHA